MVEQAGRRATVQQEVIASADDLFSQWETFETIKEIPEKNYTSKQKIDEETGAGITLIKYRCDGLTEETWSRWEQDPLAVATAINPKLTLHALPDDEGHRMARLHMKMPMVISNRSIVTCFYRTERADGFKVVCHSSRGNEA